MDEVKKRRAGKGKLVTRRTNELLSAVKCLLQEEDIVDKINTLKYALSELGSIQDELSTLLDEQNQDEPAVQQQIEKEQEWYDAYDKKVNLAIREARVYISDVKAAKESKPAAAQVKVKKLEVPKFTSQPKDFHKWKETFERYTKSFDESTKYDYLFSYTTGEAHTYVANRREYKDAMEKLEEKYGNVHDLIATLVDEIKSLSVTRRGDLRSVENLSLHVNEFNDGKRKGNREQLYFKRGGGKTLSG